MKKPLLILIAIMLIFTPLARGTMLAWADKLFLLLEYLTILLWVLKLDLKKFPAILKRNSLTVPIFLFCALAAVSFYFSSYKYIGFFSLLRLFGFVFLYYIVSQEFGEPEKKRIMYLVITIGTALSLYGLFQYFNVLPHPWWYPDIFLSSTYVNHNNFAGYLELTIPAAVAFLFSRHHKRREGGAKYIGVFNLAALVIMLLAFILTQSRGAWISLSLALLCAIAILFKRDFFNKRSAVLSVILACTILSAVYFGKDVTALRIGETDIVGDASFGTRLKIWQGSVDMIKANPITGTGIGTFIWAFPRYRPEGLLVKANFAHNEYLNMAAEMGIFAPIIMMWIFTVILKRGFRKDAPLYIIGCATGVLSLVLHGLVDFNFHIPANMLLFTLFVAFIMSGEKDRCRD